MRIPKSVLVGLAIVGAALLGWTFRASASTAARPFSTQTATIDTAKQARATSSNADDGQSTEPANITIVLGDSRSVSDRASSSSDGQPNAQVSARRSSISSESASSTGLPVGYVSPAQLGERGGSARSDIVAPAQVQGISIIANGDHIVIANDGSIVSVGDNTVVKGITGDASASGSIALDVSQSELTTGSSGLSGAPWSTTRSEGGATTATAAMGGQEASSRSATGSQTASRPTGPLPCASGSVPGGSTSSAASRAIAYAGYEVHSIDVAGGWNLVTYDDSNLFYDRVGTMNGNTGDTDTSGLNVVDSTRSFVSSGDSGDSDETPDPPPFDQSTVGSSWNPGSCSPMPGVGSVSVADVNGVSTATGQDSLVVGGDGFDDNGVHVQGDHNVATYDDGNVAIGGMGDVNAQIGDSDTAGAVVMHVTDSHIEAGDSFLPASQQAGAQVGDPFDPNDPG